MNADENDEMHVRELARGLREDPRPLCPQFRGCDHEGLYPVQGYCVLADSPGWLMLPSIEEFREYCTTPQFRACRWFRGAGANCGPGGGRAGDHRPRTDLWLAPEVLPPTRGDSI
jgi:hypothetical protein